MGRRIDYANEPHRWRQQLVDDSRIRLMSYDRFLEWLSTFAPTGMRPLGHQRSWKLTVKYISTLLGEDQREALITRELPPPVRDQHQGV